MENTENRTERNEHQPKRLSKLGQWLRDPNKEAFVIYDKKRDMRYIMK